MSQHLCLHCKKSLESVLFCFSCHSLQKLPTKPNFFEALGLPPNYVQNSQQVETKYQRLLGEIHPDFYAHLQTWEKRQSLESTSILNNAFKTLQNPLSRAEYLLSLLAQSSELNSRALPPQFLEEVFELQEKLDELLAQESQSQELLQLERDFQARLEQSYQQIENLFSEMPKAPTVAQLQTIQTQLNASRYIQRLAERSSLQVSL